MNWLTSSGASCCTQWLQSAMCLQHQYQYCVKPTLNFASLSGHITYLIVILAATLVCLSAISTCIAKARSPCNRKWSSNLHTAINLYPNQKYWCFNHLRGSTFPSLLVQHAAVIVDECSHSPRLGDGVLVCLQHLPTDVALVLTKSLQ